MKTGTGTNDPIKNGFFHENEEYGCFSNWYPAEFNYAGRHFANSEQFMMYHKVVVRLGYAFKRIKEGHSIKESIPVSLSRDKHPKLATMLFIGHTSAAAINAGKVYFTQNPMAINYPQWIAFAKYSYTQLKWALLQKPALRDRYVSGRLYEELKGTVLSVEHTFEDFSKDYIVVLE